MDVAMLLDHHGDTDLVEAFCSPDSMLTKTALASGLSCERWTHQDYDLATEEGYLAAEQRLRELRPKRLWLSPECGPFSQMQNANQRTQEQINGLIEKRRLGFKQWQSCIRLAWVQIELGGYFYIEQPHSRLSWKSPDTSARQLLDELSTSCIRDQ